jgi:membrane protein required for colicin V production
MNTLDVIILITASWGIYRGITRGLIRQIISLSSLLIAAWIASRYSEKLIEYFSLIGEVPTVVVYLCLFIAILILGYFLSKLLTHLAEKISLGLLNKIGGALLGATLYILLLSVVFKLILYTEKKIPAIELSSRQRSVFYPYIMSFSEKIIPPLTEKTRNISDKTFSNEQ